MEAVSAHTLLETRDCRHVGCTREADRGDYCDVHGRIKGIPTWTTDRILAALRADAAERGQPPSGVDWRYAAEGRPTAQTVRNAFGSWEAALAVADLAVDHPAEGSCRTPGCPHAANSRYERGYYVGLCDEVCIPKRRQEMSEIARAAATAQHERTRTRPQLVPDADDAGREERSLADLAETLEAASESYDAAVDAWEAACAAFLAHPLVRRLDVGYP